MEVETLGIARSLGWKVHMRCANGYRQETRSMRRCVYRKQLDLETLVATRGPNFPLLRLETRLMCPACGNRRVTVVFEPQAGASLLQIPYVVNPDHILRLVSDRVVTCDIRFAEDIDFSIERFIL